MRDRHSVFRATRYWLEIADRQHDPDIGLVWVPREKLLPLGPAPLADGCHPNTAGFAFYGENVAALLASLREGPSGQ